MSARMVATLAGAALLWLAGPILVVSGASRTTGVGSAFHQSSPVQGDATGGAIKGRVVAAGTAEAVRGAVVTASLAGTPAERVSATTDAQGLFEVSPLSAGAHTLTVVKRGFVTGTFGSRYHGDPGRPIDVAGGRPVDIGDFVAHRAGVIAGRVLDEYGEPMVQATVWVGRPDPVTGAFMPEGSSLRTDDRGEYRIPGLRAGHYYVRAQAGPTAMSPAAPVVVVNQAAYQPAYHPGRPSLAEAVPVEVRPGEDVSGIDLTLTRARFFSIAGRALDGGGSPATLAILSIANLDPAAEPVAAGAAVWQARGATGGPNMVAPDGAFRRSGLVPGIYSVAISRDTPTGRMEIGSTQVTIADADVTDVVVRLGPAGGLEGRVELDPPSPGFRLTQLRVAARPSGRGIPSLRVRDVVADTDGTFALQGLLGPTRVGVQSVPAGWRLRAVMVGDRDFTGQDLQIGPGQTLADVRLILTSRLGALTGTVTNTRGEALTEYVALILSADHRTWQSTGLAPDALVRPGVDGRFVAKDILPGVYDVVALADVNPASLRDPAFLERLWPSATRVVVSLDAPSQVVFKLVTVQ